MSESHDDLLARAIRRAAGGVAPITFAEVTERGRIPDVVNGEPVTDAPVLAHGDRSTGGHVMVIDIERERDAGREPAEHARRRGRWPLVAAAAAGVAVLAVGFSVADSGDRVEVTPAEEAVADPLAHGTALVDDFVDVYNTGDPEAVAERLVSPSYLEPSQLADPVYQAAGERWTRTGPCRLGSEEAVVCPIRRVDDFHGAAGLSIEEDHVFRFEDDLLWRLSFLDADPWEEALEFRAAFRSWVDAEHPQASIVWFPPAGSFGNHLADMPTVDSMPVALELVDEFVAQSDRWGT